MAVKPRRISEIKPLLTNLAQTNHFEVQFGGLSEPLKKYLQSKGVDDAFINQSAGLLCYNASLPTTNFGTFKVDGNHMGITETFAHTRQYSAITLDFYVDRDYKMLNFIESWMEFIASGSYVNPTPQLQPLNAPINPNSKSYISRMQYPKYYKAESCRIIKFDRDYRKEIEYNFRSMFPDNLTSIPVSYSTNDVLKISASFTYDRYIAGKTNSFNQYIAQDSNNLTTKKSPTADLNAPRSAEDLRRQSKQNYSFPSDRSLNKNSSRSNTEVNAGSINPPSSSVVR